MSRLFINKIILVLSLVFVQLSITAQNTDLMIEIGINAYHEGDFTKANQLFENALKVDSNKLKLQFYYGVNLIKIHQYEKATIFLKKVVKKDPSGKIFPEASYYLGEMFKQQKKYKLSILEFKKAKSHYIHNKKDFYFKKTSREINSTIYAMRHSEDIDQSIKLSRLPRPINGTNADFASFEENGKLYFSSVKDSLHAQIYVRENKKDIKLLDATIDDKNFHNANGIFFKKNQCFLFTRCDSIGHCKIMISKKENNVWKDPEELSSELNFKSHNVTQPFLTKINGNNTLFFVSDRSGGFGKLDIWYAEILDDLSIGKIKNAGAKVNSIENDITPFYHQSSNNLFFSSTWHNGFGGYDIFKSHWNDSTFEMPINVGQPLNSSRNDMYFWVNKFSKHGYVTSNRNGSMHNNSPNCCPDIWEFFSENEIIKKENITSELTSKQIFKHKTGLSLPLALYFHNDEPMPNSLETTVTQNYPETFIKYMALRQEYIKSYSEGSSIEERKIAAEQINYFFDEYLTNGLNKLKKFTSQLISLLKEHDVIEITIKGFASPLAKNDYNTNLSKRRISCLINYFNSTLNGELIPYIKSEKLIIKSAPFGEKKSSNNTSDDINNKKQSIYSPKAAIERRIEIQEVIFVD